MKTNSFFRFVLDVAACIIVVAVCFSGMKLLRDYFVATADKEMSEKIEVAKKETSDPCGKRLIRVVAPMKRSSYDKPAVIVAGEDVTPFVSTWDDLSFEPRQMPDGSLAIRIAILPEAPEYQEIMWYARNSPACRAGLGEQIKKYAVSAGREGGASRPPWPTATKVEKWHNSHPQPKPRPIGGVFSFLLGLIRATQDFLRAHSTRYLRTRHAW